MDRQIQADNAFLEWMVKMSKNVVHIADAWYAAVKWADSHPNWIPVEERLPDEGQEVFAWNGTFKESYKCIYHDGLFEDYLGELGKGAVSHWMPIVPPRKEDRE